MFRAAVEEKTLKNRPKYREVLDRVLIFQGREWMVWIPGWKF